MLLNLIIIIHRKNFYFEATGFKDPLQILNYYQLVDNINLDVIQAVSTWPTPQKLYQVLRMKYFLKNTAHL